MSQQTSIGIFELETAVRTRVETVYKDLTCLTDVFIPKVGNKVNLDVVIEDTNGDRIISLTVDFYLRMIELSTIERSALYSGRQVMTIADNLAVYISSLTGFVISLYNVATVRMAVNDNLVTNHTTASKSVIDTNLRHLVSAEADPTLLTSLALQVLQLFTKPLDFYNKFGYFPVGLGPNYRNNVAAYIADRQALLDSQVIVITGRLRQLLADIDSDTVMLHLFDSYIAIYQDKLEKQDPDENSVRPRQINTLTDVFDSYLRCRLNFNHPMVRNSFISNETQLITDIINYLANFEYDKIGDTFNYLFKSDPVIFNQLILIGLTRYITPIELHHSYGGCNAAAVNDVIINGSNDDNTIVAGHYFPFSFSHLLLKTYVKSASIKF